MFDAGKQSVPQLFHDIIANDLARSALLSRARTRGLTPDECRRFRELKDDRSNLRNGAERMLRRGPGRETTGASPKMIRA